MDVGCCLSQLRKRNERWYCQRSGRGGCPGSAGGWQALSRAPDFLRGALGSVLGLVSQGLVLQWAKVDRWWWGWVSSAAPRGSGDNAGGGGRGCDRPAQRMPLAGSCQSCSLKQQLTPRARRGAARNVLLRLPIVAGRAATRLAERRARESWVAIFTMVGLDEESW